MKTTKLLTIMADFIGEKVVLDNKKVKAFHYIDTQNKIDQLSSEIFKTIDQVIHYPRGYNGGTKYKHIKRFIFKGFSGSLPIGVYKAVKFGWGFTRQLKTFASYIDENLQIQEIVIEKDGKIEIDPMNKTLYLNQEALQFLKDTSEDQAAINKKATQFRLGRQLHKLFPANFKRPSKKYAPNTLATALSDWGNSLTEFSDNDKSSLQELFEKLSLTPDFFSTTSLAKTKEIIDSKYIQETLKEFKEIMDKKSDTPRLEAQWQIFLQKHSWIFSSIFAQPVILFRREAYVGGKNHDNQNGKYSDFLIKNNLSDNISFLELKTHKTTLMESKPYRGSDVFCPSSELTGSIAQVLNQRDNLQKEYFALAHKSKKPFKSFNSKCIVLLGSLEELTEEQKDSFEIFRNNNKDVEILTYSELLVKIESLQTLMSI